MKISFNMTTNEDDTSRYASSADLASDLAGFDGVELMCCGADERRIVEPSQVVGVHLGYYPTWLDLWRGDRDALVAEFGSLACAERHYGGLEPGLIVDRFREELRVAHAYGAEYVVFHVSEAHAAELFTCDFKHGDEEVADAAAEVLNEVFADEDGSMALLMENLWQPGLRLLDPAATQRLLERVEYPNKGIMLDTGHLLHTNYALRDQAEGLAYINRLLDRHAGLCRFVRGMHLQQSITGELGQAAIDNPPDLQLDYDELMGRVFEFSFEIDRHQPFTVAGVDELVGSLPLEWLTLELISRSRAEHARLIDMQRDALRRTLLRTGRATDAERRAWLA